MEVTDQLKRKVWQKGQAVEGFNPDLYRKDPCGAWIVWDKYGVQDSIYGWEIDHIYPKSKLEARGFRAELIDGPLTVNEATRKVLAQMYNL